MRINREALGIPVMTGPDADDVTGQLAELIRLAHAKFGATAVVLIDEYDNAIVSDSRSPTHSACLPLLRLRTCV